MDVLGAIPERMGSMETRFNPCQADTYILLMSAENIIFCTEFSEDNQALSEESNLKELKMVSHSYLSCLPYIVNLCRTMESLVLLESVIKLQWFFHTDIALLQKQ